MSLAAKLPTMDDEQEFSAIASTIKSNQGESAEAAACRIWNYLKRLYRSQLSEDALKKEYKHFNETRLPMAHTDCREIGEKRAALGKAEHDGNLDISDMRRLRIAYVRAMRAEFKNIHRKRNELAVSGSILAVTLRDIVALLSVQKGNPVCIEMPLHQHAAVWTSSIDKDGIVVIRPRDPNWTSLQSEEGFLQLINTNHLEPGWCQTWQAFDAECIITGVQEEHDALKRAAEAWCNATSSGKPANPAVVAPLLSLAHDLGDVMPKVALSTLVKYLFLRNIELLTLCSKQFIQIYHTYHRQKKMARLKELGGEETDEQAEELAAHLAYEQNLLAKALKKEKPMEEDEDDSEDDSEDESEKLWNPLLRQSAEQQVVFKELTRGKYSSAAAFTDSALSK